MDYCFFFSFRVRVNYFFFFSGFELRIFGFGLCIIRPEPDSNFSFPHLFQIATCHLFIYQNIIFLLKICHEYQVINKYQRNDQKCAKNAQAIKISSWSGHLHIQTIRTNVGSVFIKIRNVLLELLNQYLFSWKL